MDLFSVPNPIIPHKRSRIASSAPEPLVTAEAAASCAATVRALLPICCAFLPQVRRLLIGCRAERAASVVAGFLTSTLWCQCVHHNYGVFVNGA
jgi:hypothetical protein